MMCYCSKGLDLLRRTLCLFLCVVLLLCFFLVPRAQAVALEATTVAYAGLLVGTILVGAGVVFTSRGDMAKVGAAMYKTMSDGSSAIASKIAAISSWAVEHGKSIGSAALRIGKDLYQGIVDAFNLVYSDGGFSVSGDTFSVGSFGAISDFYNAFNPQYVTRFSATLANGDKVLSRIFYSSVNSCFKYEYYVNGSISARDIFSEYSNSSQFFFYFDSSYDDLAWLKVGRIKPDGSIQLELESISIWYKVPFSVTVADVVSCSAGDLAYPSDDYLVKMPDIPSVDSATGEVTYPDSIAYTKDAVAAPYPVSDDGVKVPDIPYDVPVDQSTGKALDDTGSDTDNPSKPSEGTDTDTPSDTVDWPSASDLSLPKLIISKFPFCIPFDLANMIGLLEAEPKVPVFVVPLTIGSTVDEEITLDLDQFSDVIRIIRWGELILFVAGLAFVTRNYIKW